MTVSLPHRMESGINPPDFDIEEKEIATLGGGCFWCLEAVFEQLIGVDRVESGYSGGTVVNPKYELVCEGKTGHAEVVQVRFDPKVVTYKEILEVFFAIHDPTTLNKQGADVGTQYRSVIFYYTPEQKTSAEGVIKEVEASGLWSGMLVTELAPLKEFYLAEAYHQEYYRKNSEQPYCQAIINPKVVMFRNQWFHKR